MVWTLEAGLILGQGAQWRMSTFAVITSCKILDLTVMKKGPVHFMGFLMGMVESSLLTLCAAICQDALDVNSLASGTTALVALLVRSQNEVDFARRKLQEYDDHVACCKELVDEAIKRKSGDNLSVVVVCFNSRPPPVLTAPRPRVQRSISVEGLKELQSFLDSLAD